MATELRLTRTLRGFEPSDDESREAIKALKLGASVKCEAGTCGERARSKGLCHGHYKRWLEHGDAFSREPVRKTGHGMRVLMDLVSQPETDVCILWPLRKNKAGYGICGGRGTVLANRVACAHAFGPPPTANHHAAHSCGIPACVNPRHLRWATPKENSADKVRHGTDARGERNQAAKLTATQVRQIRALRGTQSQQEIAAQFLVSPTAVSLILTGRRWRRDHG